MKKVDNLTCVSKRVYNELMENEKRLGEYKEKIVSLSKEYEADIIASPTWIPSDGGFKIGAIINIIDKKDYGKVQNIGKEDREEKRAE